MIGPAGFERMSRRTGSYRPLRIALCIVAGLAVCTPAWSDGTPLRGMTVYPTALSTLAVTRALPPVFWSFASPSLFARLIWQGKTNGRAAQLPVCMCAAETPRTCQMPLDRLE
jgi:hypothetical protein